MGSGEFVTQLIEESDEARRKQFSASEGLREAIEYIERVCEEQHVDIKPLKAGSRRKRISKVRARLTEILIEELGLSLAETGRQLGVSSSAIAKSLSRQDTSDN